MVYALGKWRHHEQKVQCVEKYLKALLQELSLPIAHTHDLEDLVDQLLPD